MGVHKKITSPAEEEVICTSFSRDLSYVGARNWGDFREEILGVKFLSNFLIYSDFAEGELTIGPIARSARVV